MLRTVEHRTSECFPIAAVVVIAKLVVTARAADATGLPDDRAIAKIGLRRAGDIASRSLAILRLMTRIPDLAVGAQATVGVELLQRTDSAVAVVAGIAIDTVLARPTVSRVRTGGNATDAAPAVLVLRTRGIDLA
jgi:hypothetical protein